LAEEHLMTNNLIDQNLIVVHSNEMNMDKPTKINKPNKNRVDLKIVTRTL